MKLTGQRSFFRIVHNGSVKLIATRRATTISLDGLDGRTVHEGQIYRWRPDWFRDRSNRGCLFPPACGVLRGGRWATLGNVMLAGMRLAQQDSSVAPGDGKDLTPLL